MNNRILAILLIISALMSFPWAKSQASVKLIDSTNTKKKIDRKIQINTVVPKGQWITGMNISYTNLTAKNYSFIIIDGATADGYMFKIQPFLFYTFKDNLAAGIKFSYDRNLSKLDKIGFDFGDNPIGFNDLYKLEHNYTGTAVLRQYVNIGKIKRFAFFSDLQLAFSGGQSKIINGKGKDLTGTYEQSFGFNLGVSPGVVAFISQRSAVELSIGLLGFNVTTLKQEKDRVKESWRKSATANFRINIFSIGLGMVLYL